MYKWDWVSSTACSLTDIMVCALVDELLSTCICVCVCVSACVCYTFFSETPYACYLVPLHWLGWMKTCHVVSALPGPCVQHLSVPLHCCFVFAPLPRTLKAMTEAWEPVNALCYWRPSTNHHRCISEVDNSCRLSLYSIRSWNKQLNFSQQYHVHVATLAPLDDSQCANVPLQLLPWEY